jgi:hypothetical protein
MSLGARLARLEAKAEAVVRCAWCRYHLVSFTPALRAKIEQKDGGERPVVYDIFTCPWCGHKFQQALGRVTEREAESLRLWYHKFDGETYTDERAYAAWRWWHFRWEKQITEQADEDAPRPAASPVYGGSYGRGRQERPKESRAVRARRELKEEAVVLVRKAREREKRLYGPRTFPLEEALKELAKDCAHYMHSHDKEDSGYRARSAAEVKARQLLAYAGCMEACELALWGEVEEETARALATLPAEAERLEETGRAEKREKEERERREREERDRQRREERERWEQQRAGGAVRAATSEAEAARESIADIIERRTGRRPEMMEDMPPRVGGSFRTDRGSRPLVMIPEIPPPLESDVSRLPDRLKYRGPRWEGDTDY